MTPRQIEKATEIFEARQQQIASNILELLGKRIKSIGEEQQTQLRNLKSYGTDVDEIARQLQKSSGGNATAIYDLFSKIAEDDYKAGSKFYDKQIPFKDNKQLQSIILAQAQVTAGEMINLSKTTTVGIKVGGEFLPLEKVYKKAIDQAVQTVTTGASTYQQEMYKVMNDIGNSGVRVEYESGYTRRLDSAVRQNILGGAKATTMAVSERMGKEFGANGVEISAHGACAPDHLPYQGKQYTKKEFERLQNTLARPIGDNNCTHTVYPIIIGISEPSNSKDELKQYKSEGTDKKKYGDKEYTLYEATQVQRKLETEMRYTKEKQMLGKTSGIDKIVTESDKRISQLATEYNKFSKAFGIPTQKQRMRVEGYKK